MKEKILDILVQTGWDEKLNDIQQMADDYAIEFAEWIKTDWSCDERWSKITDSKELLEIFKKEKGL